MAARGPGRPPIDPRVRKDASVYVRVPARQYDAAYTRAQRERISVPELIRRAARSAFEDDDDDDDER